MYRRLQRPAEDQGGGVTTLFTVGLPHTQPSAEFLHCAYTTKTVRFPGMMKAQGFRTVLLSGDECDADVDELVTIMPRKEQEELLAEYDWYPANISAVDWNHNLPFWRVFNERAIEALRERVKEGDWICLISGRPYTPIIEAFPDQCVEFGIGYSGTAAPFRVFESYSWMHAVYGWQAGDPMMADGQFFDAVISNSFPVEDFPPPNPDGVDNGRDPYYVFMSRMTWRKGYQIAFDATANIGATLKVAGVPGDEPLPDHVEHVGLVDAKQRGELLSRAQAVFLPTIYVEPFGGVAAESLLCGTPVIATDWGAMPELIEQGVDGFRCRTLKEFEEAALSVDSLDRKAIRGRAQARFGLEPVGSRYADYFHRLGLLKSGGFYSRA